MDTLLLFGSEAGLGSLINTERVITEALGYCNNIYVCSGNSVIVKIHTAKKLANECLGQAMLPCRGLSLLGLFQSINLITSALNFYMFCFSKN